MSTGIMTPPPASKRPPKRDLPPPPPWGPEAKPGPWDTVIIGSGMGSMALATALAKTGDRVLILEQHYEAGGFTHTFRRKSKYEWDVGVHYMGDVQPRSNWYAPLIGMVGELSFSNWSDPVDILRFPDTEIHMPGTYAEYTEQLTELFPSERAGIEGYFEAIRDSRKQLSKFFTLSLLPNGLNRVLRSTLFKKATDYALSTTNDIMARHLKDERLKDILDAQWGNIGMPRDRCSFMSHAAMIGLFLESGGYYPNGGGSVFARKFGEELIKHDSWIRTKARVREVIIRNGKAEGVILEDGEEILAKRVVSNIGAQETYNTFLRDQPNCAPNREAVNKIPHCYEYLNLFFGLDVSPAEVGIGPENYWIHNQWTSESGINEGTYDPFWRMDPNSPTQRTPPIQFINFSTIRDEHFGQWGHTGHSGQLISMATQAYFDKWLGSNWKKRTPEYNEVKEEIIGYMLEGMEKNFPGINKHITVTELATPLTYIHYSEHHRGVPYGLAPIPDRFQPGPLKPQTPVKNFFLVGQDLIMPGVSAAFASGLLTASWIRRKHMGKHFGNIGRQILGVS